MEIKDNLKEKRLFTNRTIVAVIGVFFMLAILIAQMFNLQVVNYEKYQTRSVNNRIKVEPQPPRRGLIYDRNGVILADNTPSFQLTLIPEEIKNISDTTLRLRNIIEISDEEMERFEKLMKNLRRNNLHRFDHIPIKFQLTDTEVARFAINRHLFPGVYVKAHIARRYPLKEVASHIIGYVGRINEQELKTLDYFDYAGSTHVGKTGIEKYYEDTLHGDVGEIKVEKNVSGRYIRTIEETPPKPGNDIYLTIDSTLQMEIEKAFGIYSGAVVAIEPASGEILAMVSQPGFDLNLFVNGISSKKYKELQEHKRRPLFNRLTRGQYPPGSTTKPMVGLAGLHYGVVTPEDEVFCPGYYMLPNVSHKYRCWKKWGHGKVNLNHGIAQSCDVYFYDLSYKLGIDRMSTFLGRFGLGQKTGIDLPGEKSGIMPSREWKKRVKNEPWYHGETLISGIGQGFTLTTPLQLAQATALIANRGKYVKPHLLRHHIDPATKSIEQPEFEQSGKDIDDVSPEDWQTVIQAMHDVVHGKHGTARKIGKDAPYKFAGKTGTAQVFGVKQDEEARDNEELAFELRDHALFIAFAPIDKPKIAVAVIVEHGGGGSSVAAPVARIVLDKYLLGESVGQQYNQIQASQIGHNHMEQEYSEHSHQQCDDGHDHGT